jgi:Fe(3+) dicitrate transport protein
VEYAPKNIERVGLNYSFKNFSMNLQYSYTASCYSDAANTVFAANALTGIIPAYHVVDFSSSYRVNQKLKLKFGINNLTNEKYFTIRTDEYPGPGIIPSIGRMYYAGISAKF